MIVQPNILPVPGEAYQLAEAWGVAVWPYHVYVPRGFVSDGASVPRFLWALIPPDGLHRAAALAHDWLYATHGAQRFTRAEADAFFRLLLVAAGVSRAKAALMWLAVRAFGWLAWSRSSGVPRLDPLHYQVS